MSSPLACQRLNGCIPDFPEKEERGRPGPPRPALQPAPAPPAMNIRYLDGNDPGSRPLVTPYLRAFGAHCLSHSTMQEGMHFFFMEDVGYLSYFMASHPILARQPRKIVISNPVCAPGDMERLLAAFLAREALPIFVQVERPCGELLARLGLEVNQIGVETDLPLPFSLTGNRRGKLRQWRNKALREGVEVFEAPLSSMDLKEVRALSQDWLSRKGGVELRYLSRPLVYADEPGVRTFFAACQGRVVGLAVFDPMYRDGRIIGYYHNMDRLHRTAPGGTSALIVLTALERFTAEGLEKLALGMSPMCDMEDDLNANRFMASLLSVFKRCTFLYPFEGNESHKRKFDGSRFKVYAASRKNNISTMIAASLAFGLV